MLRGLFDRKINHWFISPSGGDFDIAGLVLVGKLVRTANGSGDQDHDKASDQQYRMT
jgi:hypothetical protein